VAERSDEIRDEIEHTRREMGDTVDALAYKADVPTRTKEWIGEKKDAITSKVDDVTPSRVQIKGRLQDVKHGMERNPLGLAIGGAAVGLVAGLLAPSTRIEDERVGRMADDVKSTAADAGREAFERGREVVQEAGQTAMETAVERGKEESQELASSLQEQASETSGAPGETERTGTSRP
jgi:hypothetical protein